jgi:hypothetical protein
MRIPSTFHALQGAVKRLAMAGACASFVAVSEKAKTTEPADTEKPAPAESPVPAPEQGGHSNQNEENETSMMTDF